MSALLNLDPSYAKPLLLVPGSKKLSSEEKKQLDKKIEEMRKEDMRMVTGVFINVEVPGGSESFPFRKYKGDPIIQYSFEDGKTYTIPKMVADHLNENCYNIEHEHHLDTRVTSPKIYDKDGVVMSSRNFTGKKNHRFRFSITKWE